MKELYPNRKIGLVTFDSIVTVIGDGVEKPIVIQNDDLNNYDKLFSEGIKLS